jgi:hypothetical protein
MAKKQNITRDIPETIFVQLPSLILGIITGVFITRLLGPEGKGVYAILYANSELLVLFLTLGIDLGYKKLITTSNGDIIGSDIAMQITAMKPKYLSKEDVPADMIEAMTAEYSEGIDDSKPEEIKKRILEGRLNKKYEEICLVNQKFIKEDSKTISQLLKEADKNVSIKQYVRLEV